MILHHFDASPFSEKIRLIFGYKRLAWSSVKIPRILPKPDLMPLTGGYRRTPVLQIGCDIYADTRLIARVIDARAPQPALCPAGTAASGQALETLGDQQLFLAAIPILLSPAGRTALAQSLGADGLAAFRADRAALFENGGLGAPDRQYSTGVWAPMIQALDAQLTHQRFLLGDAPQLADFSVYHPVWYVRRNPGVADHLDGAHHVLAWADRMAALGHGQPTEMMAEQAQAAARSATDFEPLAGTVEPALGLSAGQEVAVSAIDYGADRVLGRLVHADTERVVIARESPASGPVHNHFPRRGFRIESVEGEGRPDLQAQSESVY